MLFLMRRRNEINNNFIFLQTAKRASKEGSSKYNQSARAMLLFVAMYPFQWWAYVVYSCWMLAEDPPLISIIFTVSFSNMGGVFNLITYILLRRQRQNKIKQSGCDTKTYMSTRKSEILV